MRTSVVYLVLIRIPLRNATKSLPVIGSENSSIILNSDSCHHGLLSHLSCLKVNPKVLGTRIISILQQFTVNSKLCRISFTISHAVLPGQDLVYQMPLINADLFITVTGGIGCEE